MEKYGQYRDKGSGIAPFFPVSSEGNSLLFPWHLFLFCLRVPLVAFAWFVWLAIIQWTPPGNILRKANLWCILGIPGVWWIDIQVDGVRRGSLSQFPRGRLPSPGTIIASSYTSPLDILYLSAIFDPIFTVSSPGSRLVRPVTIEGALASTFALNPPFPFNNQNPAQRLSDLIKQNPTRTLVVFPESTTSNARGILKSSHSLLSASASTSIFPVSLRYTPTDIVTPIPGWLEVARFIWRLNSRPTHCIRVRIGAPVSLTSPPAPNFESSPARSAITRPTSPPSSSTANTARKRNSYDSNFFDTLQSSPSPAQKVSGDSTTDADGEGLSEQEKRLLDAVADALARLGRVKRVGLGAAEKEEFVRAWWARRGARR
ncbi:Lysophosphatidic acid:oleoyl-CoA acyltransferase 1 [Vermiconidia calcicola]|uniref:Lysophosphatidic acid:oleoyl-CoA acyltransferase 1 n=1 Tax=Vermiconidia calcicola TaxID=1690605 RepID=A0ACC3MTC5_9PEZI|nr:Lysophosphatidic acid:oleoyl-CoA acyltransferase 1 [Vermiconidia calcicola]